MIAVFGATGDLGRRIVRILRELNEPVRAVSRDPVRLEQAVTLGAEPVVADLGRPETLGPALAGVETVATTANAIVGKGDNDLQRVDVRGNAALVDAARRQGVRRFVFVSARGARPDHPTDFFRAKAATEALLAASGMSVALLQPSAFMEIWAALLGDPLLAGKPVQVFGRGRNPVPFVASEDVARAAVALARAGPTPGVERVALGGPEAFTHLEVVALFARLSGLRPRIRHVPRAMLRTLSVLLRPVASVPARMMSAALWMDTEDQQIDPAPAVARFGRLTSLEEFARARLTTTRAATGARAA
ncbi:MAG TPA: NAD(P)H-binding protein [Myxococcaceae bacterium]|nr:NAD(P)H-binding protein [Myxococcaceae bacterium]